VVDPFLSTKSRFEGFICLTSGYGDHQCQTSFNVTFAAVPCPSQQMWTEVSEERLLNLFIVHAGIFPTTTSDGHSRANFGAGLGRKLIGLFAFLRSFSMATVNVSARDRLMVKGSVSFIYVKLCQLLCEKSDHLCAFALLSLSRRRYCTPASSEERMKDCLIALACYYRVLQGLVGWERTSFLETTPPLDKVCTSAEKVMHQGRVKEWFLKIHAAMRAERKQDGTTLASPDFEELMNEFCPQDLPQILCFLFCFTVTSCDNQAMPEDLPTAVNYQDSYQDVPHIRVRDLFEQTDATDLDLLWPDPDPDHHASGMPQSPGTAFFPYFRLANPISPEVEWAEATENYLDGTCGGTG
jgi:hypothetical protein